MDLVEQRYAIKVGNAQHNRLSKGILRRVEMLSLGFNDDLETFFRLTAMTLKRLTRINLKKALTNKP